MAVDDENIMMLSEFDQMVNSNKKSGRNWYHGLEGKWWWGKSEKHVRRHIAKLEEESREKVAILEEERMSVNKIVLASTWGISCGIATYTKYLLDELDKIVPNLFVIDPIIDGKLKYVDRGKLIHLQHEIGIVPEPPENIRGKLIVTWHAVSKRTDARIKEYESKYDVVAHIVHSEHMRRSLDVSKDARRSINKSKHVWAVPHGSTLIPEMKKEYARMILGININIPIGFVFGFQGKDKNYQRLIDAARNTGIHIIISGAQHKPGNSFNIANDKNVTFINRFIEENEVNLYAQASDILLFDYIGKSHYSVSGALHRIIGARRPVVCPDINHFGDIENGTDCLKFKDQEELEKCIRHALENTEKFSLAAKNYAEKTSWEKIAKMHMEIYKRYTDI